MEEGCLFCRIIAGKMSGDIVYQDDKAVVLRDINPQAPTHLLIIPREHVASLVELGPARSELTAHLIHLANEMARREGIAEKGYRVAVNFGSDGGQVIPHVHFHLLGGRELSALMG